MIQYTIRRIFLAIPVLFSILVVVFGLARAIPGDPCKSILGEKASAETCERFAQEYGLDKPIPVQFAIYMGDVLRGDLGESIRFGRPITQILAERLPMTVELGVTAMILALLVGVPAGILSAVKRNSIVDVVTMFGANLGVSMPVFFLGLLLIYFFAVVLKETPFALPPSGRLSPGLSPKPFYEIWEWEAVEGSGRFLVLEFFSNLCSIKSRAGRRPYVFG